MTPPSNFALRIIVEEDPKVVQTVNAHHADAAADGGLKALEKDALFDVLARHFTGRPGLAPAARIPPGGSWPTSRTP
jgi:hypothetical protein